MLQVGIDEYNGCSPRVIQARRQGNFLSKISGETKDSNRTIATSLFGYFLERVVRASIINANYLVSVSRFFEYALYSLYKCVNVSRLVEHRGNNGYFHILR